jgi:hypothetical protein
MSAKRQVAMNQVAVVLLLTATFVSGQELRKEYRDKVDVAGKLETTLLSNPAPLFRHELGSLTSPGTVRLFAVVASEPSSERIAKGLEIQLEGDDELNGNRHCKEKVYIDEDVLSELEENLASAVKDEERLLPRIDDYDRAELRVPSVTYVGNRGSDEGVYNLRVTFGWYWDEGRFGVYVVTPDFGEPRFAQFCMPNADISELLRFVHKGREWLNTHPLTAIN